MSSSAAAPTPSPSSERIDARAIRAVVRKDLLAVRQSRPVVIPMIIVPLVMLVVLPVVFALAARAAGSAGDADVQQLIGRMPAGLAARYAVYALQQQVVVVMLGYLLAPMYLILPLMVASVIAADSFAGEKERKTMEALLHTPTTDRELFLAKVLAAWLPAVAVALGGVIVYGAVTTIAAWPIMGRFFLPLDLWLTLALWVAPAVAGLGLGTTVLISARVQTFQEAFQLGSLIVLPLVALLVGQATGLIFLGVGLVLLLGLFGWLGTALLLLLGFRLFRRDVLAASL